MQRVNPPARGALCVYIFIHAPPHCTARTLSPYCTCHRDGLRKPPFCVLHTPWLPPVESINSSISPVPTPTPTTKSLISASRRPRSAPPSSCPRARPSASSRRRRPSRWRHYCPVLPLSSSTRRRADVGRAGARRSRHLRRRVACACAQSGQGRRVAKGVVDRSPSSGARLATRDSQLGPCRLCSRVGPPRIIR